MRRRLHEGITFTFLAGFPAAEGEHQAGRLEARPAAAAVPSKASQAAGLQKAAAEEAQLLLTTTAAVEEETKGRAELLSAQAQARLQA